jgi:hypothetical protein
MSEGNIHAPRYHEIGRPESDADESFFYVVAEKVLEKQSNISGKISTSPHHLRDEHLHEQIDRPCCDEQAWEERDVT